jgi:hypothetical protein
MKIITLLFLLLSFNAFSQGKYAGNFKTLLGKKYIVEKDIKALKNYQYRGGNVIGDINEMGPYYSIFEIFTTHNAAVIIKSKLINTQTKQYSIIEVLHLTKLPKGFEVRTTGCDTNDPNPDEPIVAVVMPNGTTVYKAFKLKGIRFEEISKKMVLCVNEGED